MNVPYIIHCCSGTGGLFLTSVFAQIYGYDVKSVFSQSGHAHDMGQGNWGGAPGVCFVGNHWDIKYRSGFVFYYTHCIPDNFLKHNSDIKLVLVQTDPQDYEKVTELYVKKAWPDIWTEEEYNKWVGPGYPPYSPSNIPDSDIIVNDLVNDLKHTITEKWYQDNCNLNPDYVINFRTIMGLNNIDLVDQVCDILKCPESPGVRDYVIEYQQLNQNLYFKNYLGTTCAQGGM